MASGVLPPSASQGVIGFIQGENMNEEQSQGEIIQESQPKRSWWGALALILLATAAGFGIFYGILQHQAREQLAVSRDALQASLAQTQNQVEALRMKLDDLSQAKAAAPAVTEAPHAANPQQGAVRHAAVKRRPVEDPRWNRVQTELDAQRKEIADHQRQIQDTQANLQQTRSELEGNLNSTRDELNGSIAKNHEELVELEKKGERNFTEFDLGKSKQFSRVGPISLAVRKANTKHQYCDLEMLVDDVKLSKKHVNLYEPVMFYPQGYSQPLELVIYKISKDRAHGYLSAPKYGQAQRAASAPQMEPVPAPQTTQLQLDHRVEPQQ
jgi:hypothetical protein